MSNKIFVRGVTSSLLLLGILFGSAFAKDQLQSNFFRTSDGINIHYLTLGDKGSFVILVHAYGANAEGNWVRTGIMQALAKKHRVVAIDCRNHGKSDRPNPNRFGIASDVTELMDHLKIEKAHLHGYSMGGGITAQILLANQDRLITASLGGSGIGEIDPQRIAELKKDKPSPRGVAASPIRPGPQESLEYIKIPVLVLAGEYDNPNEKTTRMQREMPNFKSVIIRGRGHPGAVLDGKYLSELVKFVNSNDS